MIGKHNLVAKCGGVALLAACLVVVCARDANAARFQFGSNANGLTGASAAALVDDGFGLSFVPSPSGAAMHEGENMGLGVDSRPALGADAEPSKFNCIAAGPLAGQGESVQFWFDRSGVITELLFDGVKDETLEFFRLDAPGGMVYTFFDSQIGLRTDVSQITEPNVTLLGEDIPNGIDDDIAGLAIPFQAGDMFTLTYGEFSAAGLGPGNGARWQGVVVRAPEPTTALLTAIAAVGLAIGSLRAVPRRACSAALSRRRCDPHGDQAQS